MKMLIAAAAMMIVAAPALAQSGTYRALGTEPFWSATVDARQMTFTPADGRAMTVAKPRAIIGFNGERYATQRMTIDITHVECSDGMSDRTFHDTVRVNVNGREYRGCGGEVLSGTPVGPTLLEGSWSVQSLGGRPLAPGSSNVRVQFEGSRISGNAGCNRFNGSFRFASGRLNAGPLASTKMACVNPALNRQEARLLSLLGERLTVSRNRAGKLVMTSRSGQTLVLAPARSR